MRNVARSIVEPRDKESRYRPIPTGINLDDVFCMKYERKVNNGQTVSFNNRLYRLEGTWVGSLAKKEITIIEPDSGPLRGYYGHLPITLKEIQKPLTRWDLKMRKIRSA